VRFFGRNVLRGLVEGIDDFLHMHRLGGRRSGRWAQWFSGRRWIDDQELIDKLGEFSAACIVIAKQDQSPWKRLKCGRSMCSTSRLPECRCARFGS
jgi:hypothetical protein